jgi:hypothetical protein
MPKLDEIVPIKLSGGELDRKLYSMKNAFVKKLVELSNDQKKLDIISKELATPRSNQGKQYEKSKNNQSETLREAVLSVISQEEFKIPFRNSVWVEIIDLIKLLAKEFHRQDVAKIAPALKIIIDANKKASVNWKGEIAKLIRRALTQSTSKDEVRESEFWPYMKAFQWRKDVEARSKAYKEYKDEIGSVKIPIDRILSAIKEFYEKGLSEKKLPDIWQKYMFCALQMASGLRKPELLNFNTTDVKIDEKKTGVVVNWDITTDPKTNSLIIKGVAKKADKAPLVELERPLVGLTTKQFMVGLDKIRPLVAHLTTERKDTATAKQQNKEIEKDPQWLGMNKIWKDKFKEAFDHVQSYKDKTGVKRGIKNFGRQLYAGAIPILFNPEGKGRTRLVKKMFAHDSSESTLNYELIEVVPSSPENPQDLAKGLPSGLKDCQSCQALLNEITMQRQQLKSQSMTNTELQNMINELKERLIRRRQKSDKTDKQQIARKAKFDEVAAEMQKKNEKITIENVMGKMQFYNKAKIQVWVKELKNKLKESKPEPKSEPKSEVSVPDEDYVAPENEPKSKDKSKDKKKKK